MKKIDIIRVFVPGDSVFGLISNQSKFQNGGILVLKSLEIIHYSMVMNSIGIICEKCQKTSHIVVVCRIMGIPVVQVQSINFIDQYKKFIHINFQDSQVQFSENEFTVLDKPLECNYCYPRIQHQLSIVNSNQLIDRIKTQNNDDVEQIFLRSELMWLSLQTNPYYYLSQNGIQKTAQKIQEELLPLCKKISNNLILNFRGLDLRSDQGLFEEQKVYEPNPHLGLHGIRQLLVFKDYLLAELLAVDSLYSMGYTNVIYSLPFVISPDEVHSVTRLKNKHCKNKFDIGVFIETPASVFEIDSILSNEISYVYIGTKDLSQLVLAVDRDNSRVSHLMNLVSPSIIKAIRYVLESCIQYNIPAFVFSMPADIPGLIESLPLIQRISIPAADYFHHKLGYSVHDNIRATNKTI